MSMRRVGQILGYDSVHNKDNWLYDLEGQNESPTPLETHPTYEYHPTPLPGAPPHTSTACAIPHINHVGAFDALRTDVATLREDVAIIRLDFHGLLDVTHA